VSPENLRVALVTGGGRGLGAEVVRGLAARGYAVAIHCHASLREARELAAEIEAGGGRAIAVTANFREEGAVRAMVHRVLDHFGRVDAVAACARLRQLSSLEDLSTGDLLAHHQVNVVGTFIVAQEVLPAMRSQPEGGVLVALSTSNAPQPGDLASATSQAGVPALMEALAVEASHRHPQVHARCVIAPSNQPTADTASTILAVIDGCISRS
jgi:3-oxoacyl-[acyl-carrier protein] reductase